MQTKPNDTGLAADKGLGANTGRLKAHLPDRAQNILFQRGLSDALSSDLPLMANIDRAHLVMLSAQKLIADDKAASLLRMINALHKEEFASLKNRPAPRGWFLLYESYLIEKLGANIGGYLQFGRSRNDLNATIHILKLRSNLSQFLLILHRLEGLLLCLSQRYQNVVMPAYTHYQAALPITLGYYYAGLAQALIRDLQSLHSNLDSLKFCPLGAGAVAGTTLAIDPTRTAHLLGFEGPCRHATDAVASRDSALRTLASLSVLAVTVSRIVHDLQLWTTREYNFIALPDSMVGSSSMMPQKRNAYIFEHIKGKSATALGAFVSASQAMHATPFSNSIAVGTEAIQPIWQVFSQLSDALILLTMLLNHATPNITVMEQSAKSGFVTATALADWLVRSRGVSFRQAHHDVGGLVTDALEHGISDLTDAVTQLRPEWLDEGIASVTDPASVVRTARYGGGPAPEQLAELTQTLRQANVTLYQRLRALRTRQQQANAMLSNEAGKLMG